MADIKLEYNYASKDLQKFKESGQFSNNLDEFGNFRLMFDQNKTTDGKFYYTKLDLKTIEYNESKIVDTNNADFVELEELETQQKQDLDEILKKYNQSLEENRILNETVNVLVEKYENSSDKQVIEAMRRQIIDLRIQLGQGNVSTDFSISFPFLPLT